MRLVSLVKCRASSRHERLALYERTGMEAVAACASMLISMSVKKALRDSSIDVGFTYHIDLL